MTLMVWNDNLVTGIDIVDQQHRGLVDMINEAGPLLAQNGDRHMAEAGPLLARLLDYAAVHFTTEEGLMESHGVDPRVLAHHRNTHAGFVDQVKKLVGAYSEGQGVTGDQLLSFLASWLVLHIMGEDQAMARQLRARSDGMAPAQAYAAAGGDQLDPAPAALSLAFADLYSTLTRQNRDLEISRQEIAEHNLHLEETVRQRTLELEKSRDAAEAASVAKSRFLGTMSHELRTPMNAIMGYAGLLQGQAREPQGKGLAGKILTSSNQLLELLDGMIEYSRLESGQIAQAASEPFDLGTLLAEASRKAFEDARRKGLACAIEIADSLPPGLLGDRRRLTAIVAKLADNACKFTSQGHVVLRAQDRGRDGQGQVRLRIEVEDTGIGIAPADRERLFGAFNQLDDRPERKFEGIGLGLAMARRLARLLDGDIDVASRPGEGSRFWLDVCLPVAAPSGAADAAPAPLEPARSGTATAKPAPVAPNVLRGALNQLEQLLAENDTRAARAFAIAAPHFERAFGEQAVILARQIEDFDYDLALNTVRELNKACAAIAEGTT